MQIAGLMGGAMILLGLAGYRWLNSGARSDRSILKIADPDVRIKKMEELYRKGRYKKHEVVYYTNLSVCYYDKGDYETAIRLLVQAEAECERSKLSLVGQPGNQIRITEFLKTMKITNLTVMRCPEQAQTLLAQLDVDKITEPVILHSVYLNTARLALLNKDADLAEKYFDKLEKISLDNDDKAVREVLLARAECDLLRGKPQAAMRKLNEIPEAEATDSIRQRIHALKSRMY